MYLLYENVKYDHLSIHRDDTFKFSFQKYCVFEDAEVVLRNASINGTESNYTEANATALDEVPIGKCKSNNMNKIAVA